MKEVINTYSENFDKSIEVIWPQNIYNYDKTNVRDNPRSKVNIVRHGRKKN